MEKGEFHEAVVGCPCESDVWTRPNARCWLLLLCVPQFSGCLDRAYSPLPDSEIFLPPASGKLGWSPKGPFPSRRMPYASMTKHTSTISIARKRKEPLPDSECAPGHTAPCPTHCPPSPSCMDHSCPHHKLRNTSSVTQFIGFRG